MEEGVKTGKEREREREREREKEKTETALPARALSGLWLSEQCQETSAWKFLPSLRACVPAIRGLVLQAADVTWLGEYRVSRINTARAGQYTLQTVAFYTDLSSVHTLLTLSGLLHDY